MKKNLDWLIDVLKFLLRDLAQDGWRTIITVLNLLTFLCCYFCLAALSEAARQFGVQDDDKNTLMVIQKDVFDPGDSVITEAEFAPIRALEPDQVSVVSPLIFRLLKIDTYLIQVRGALRQDMQDLYSLSIKEGRFPDSQTEVAIGEGTSLLTKWTVGEVIKIYGKEFEIVGILSSPGSKSSAVWMTLDTAEALFGTHEIYQFAWIKVAQDIDPEKVKLTLQNDPQLSKKFDVYYVDQMYAQYSNALNDVRIICNLLVILALMLVVFGTYGSIFLTLAERSREITILRAIGFGSSSIRKLLVVRMFILIIISYFGSWLTSIIILRYLGITHPITVHGILTPVSISVKIFYFGLVLSLILGGIGIWLSTRGLKHTTVFKSIYE